VVKERSRNARETKQQNGSDGEDYTESERMKEDPTPSLLKVDLPL
jgi:hypothetical protein